jgi:hypothetical protein
MDKQLIAAYQMFLVPASILFTALGVARTEGLKTGISAIGIMMSGVWGSAIWNWNPPLPPVQSRIALSMPIIFGIIAIIAFIVHLRLYMKSLSQRQESQVEGG